MSKTLWLARNAEHDAPDDWTEVEASVDTPEEAACQFAIEANHMSITPCYHFVVKVKQNDTASPETYEVEMELQPHYTAYPVRKIN